MNKGASEIDFHLTKSKQGKWEGTLQYAATSGCLVYVCFSPGALISQELWKDARIKMDS
jgi:hypothetical protein